MASTLIRAVIVYGLLTIILRLMGKRQIGELDVGDLVSTLLISELAAIPIDDPDIPLFNALIPILFIFSIEVILSTLKNKSERLKSALDGDAWFIIYKGRLLQKALFDNRLSVNELLAALRSQGVGDIGEVEYAILEQNGTISILERGKSNMAHTLLIDGELIDKTADEVGISRADIYKELAEAGVEQKDVFLMTIDDSGAVNILQRDEKNEG